MSTSAQALAFMISSTGLGGGVRMEDVLWHVSGTGTVFTTFVSGDICIGANRVGTEGNNTEGMILVDNSLAGIIVGGRN